MRGKLAQLCRRPLAVILAACLCVAASPALSPVDLGAFAADRTDNSNTWQIVSGQYDASYTTSQGLSSSQLASHNFVESNDGQVRVTKTVEQTGIEDEFTVHLSIDTSATSTQVTDYYSYFETAEYMAVTSNKYHSDSLGGVVESPAGTDKVQVSGDSSTGSKNATFDIKDPNGKLIAQDVTLYWSQANKITILLKINDSKYILLGVAVTSGGKNEVQFSNEAYTLIEQAIAGSTQWGDLTRLESVVDIMGDDVDYIGGAACDGGTVAYDSSTRALTWSPSYSSSYTVVYEDSVVVEERNSDGAVTKVTVTQRKWCYGAASLTYKVRLNTQAVGFASSYNPDDVANAYKTNNSATLAYSYSTDGGQTYSSGTVEFPKPQVKGILYDLRIKKANEVSTPLAGAKFKLTRAWTDSLGEAHEDLVSSELVSDADGYVTVTSLPWGTYTLEETEPPRGHTMRAGSTATFELCYTSNSANLTSSILSDSSKHHAMLGGDIQTIVNDRVKTDVTLLKVDANTSDPLAGAKFALYADDGDGVFDKSTDCVESQKVEELETAADGTALFEQLTVGTYYLAETYTPAGYYLDSNVYRVDVYDVKGEAGGTQENMIRVGNATSTDMLAPDNANTITIADRPIPALPVAAGPGIRGLIACGFALFAIGALALAAGWICQQRRLDNARHLIR